MAVLGLLEVEAVNLMLQTVNQNPVTALDPSGVTGTSIQARAQETLERVALEKLIAGYEENTINTTLLLDLATTAGTISAASAAGPSVITLAESRTITTAAAIEFYGVNSYPQLSGPYAIGSGASASTSITLAAGTPTVTTAGTSGSYRTLSKITVPANALRIIGNGQDGYRTFALDATANKLIDIDRAATQFFGNSVSVKLVFLPGTWGGSGASGSTAFESLKPDTKFAIVKEAAVIFQRRFRGSPEQDQQLVEEASLTEVGAARPTQNRNDQPINVRPITMVPPQGRQQQGQ